MTLTKSQLARPCPAGNTDEGDKVKPKEYCDDKEKGKKEFKKETETMDAEKAEFEKKYEDEKKEAVVKQVQHAIKDRFGKSNEAEKRDSMVTDKHTADAFSGKKEKGYWGKDADEGNIAIDKSSKEKLAKRKQKAT